MGEASVWWLYVVVFGASLVASWTMTPLAMRVAVRHRIFDSPGGHKSHGSPVPYLGGLAVVSGFSLSVFVASVLSQSVEVSKDLLVVLLTALLLSLLGLVDDLRGLSATLRLCAEVAAGFIVWSSGSGSAVFGNQVVDLVVTILWVVGITNSFNLLDNMDGLSAGIASIACMSFFSIAAANDQFLVASLSVALSGCAIGFLRHNFHPAKIYMGDSGALFFGFLIAYIGMKLRFDIPQEISVAVPVLVCSVAVLDTALVTVARLRHGLSPFVGGRDHISHRLVKVGLPVPVAVGVLYFLSLLVAIVSFVVARVDEGSAWILTGVVFASLVVVGILMSRVPVYSNSRHRLFRILPQTQDSE